MPTERAYQHETREGQHESIKPEAQSNLSRQCWSEIESGRTTAMSHGKRNASDLPEHLDLGAGDIYSASAQESERTDSTRSASGFTDQSTSRPVAAATGETVIVEGGTIIRKYPDGSERVESPDGRAVERNRYGQVTAQESPQPDGSIIRTEGDEVTEIRRPDDSVIRRGRDGSVETTTPGPDGTVTRVTRDGTTEITRPDGTIERKFPDGRRQVARPDGVTQEYGPDGAEIL